MTFWHLYTVVNSSSLYFSLFRLWRTRFRIREFIWISTRWRKVKTWRSRRRNSGSKQNKWWWWRRRRRRWWKWRRIRYGSTCLWSAHIFASVALGSTQRTSQIPKQYQHWNRHPSGRIRYAYFIRRIYHSSKFFKETDIGNRQIVNPCTRCSRSPVGNIGKIGVDAWHFAYWVRFVHILSKFGFPSNTYTTLHSTQKSP